PLFAIRHRQSVLEGERSRPHADGDAGDLFLHQPRTARVGPRPLSRGAVDRVLSARGADGAFFSPQRKTSPRTLGARLGRHSSDSRRRLAIAGRLSNSFKNSRIGPAVSLRPRSRDRFGPGARAALEARLSHAPRSAGRLL